MPARSRSADLLLTGLQQEPQGNGIPDLPGRTIEIEEARDYIQGHRSMELFRPEYRAPHNRKLVRILKNLPHPSDFTNLSEYLKFTSRSSDGGWEASIINGYERMHTLSQEYLHSLDRLVEAVDAADAGYQKQTIKTAQLHTADFAFMFGSMAGGASLGMMYAPATAAAEITALGAVGGFALGAGLLMSRVGGRVQIAATNVIKRLTHPRRIRKDARNAITQINQVEYTLKEVHSELLAASSEMADIPSVRLERVKELAAQGNRSNPESALEQQLTHYNVFRNQIRSLEELPSPVFNTTDSEIASYFLRARELAD